MASNAIPRLVLWDIDHTLIETRGAGGRFARAAFQDVTGRPADQMAEATGKTERVILAETLRAYGIAATEDLHTRYAQALSDQYRRNVRHLTQVGRALPGAVATLAALGQVPGITQTVLTGNYKAVATTKLAAFGLGAALDLNVGAYADDGADRAALVGIAQGRAAERVGHLFTKDDTVIVGDTPQDVAAGQHGGAAVVAIASGTHSVEDLRRAGADRVLADLTNSDAVIQAIVGARYGGSSRA